MMLKRFIIILAVLCSCMQATAQEDWVTSCNFNFGCTYQLNTNFSKIRFPGMKLFCGLSVNGVYKEHFLVNYGPSLSFYVKTIGTNLNPLVHDLQLDFTNSVTAGVCFGADLSYYKFYRTLDNGGYYNTVLNKENAISLTSNFILNNHGRHQINGAMTLSTADVTVNYCNDGGTPFDKIPIADNFDRYWTGTFTVFAHSHSGYNSFEMGFVQFTGYKPLLFEACDILGINVPDYNSDKDSKFNSSKLARNNYNTSAYYVNVFMNRNLSATVGWMGALKIVNRKTYNQTYFGLQEMIHSIFNFPMHPNQDDGKFYFGVNYNHANDEKL